MPASLPGRASGNFSYGDGNNPSGQQKPQPTELWRRLGAWRSRRPTTTPPASPSGSWRRARWRCPGPRSPSAGSRPPRAEDIDRVRRLLCHEPRGHADMYGCFVVPPDDDGADLGVLFWHKDGYSTACGHGTIALGAWAVESGRVDAPADGEVDVTIDVPSGRVVARVRCRAGAVESVAFRNVPSYVVARGVQVAAPRSTWPSAGAIYAFVAADRLGAARRRRRAPRAHRRRTPDQGRPRPTTMWPATRRTTGCRASTAP